MLMKIRGTYVLIYLLAYDVTIRVLLSGGQCPTFEQQLLSSTLSEIKPSKSKLLKYKS